MLLLIFGAADFTRNVERTLVVAEEDRLLIVVVEDRQVVVPAEPPPVS